MVGKGYPMPKWYKEELKKGVKEHHILTPRWNGNGKVLWKKMTESFADWLKKKKVDMVCPECDMSGHIGEFTTDCPKCETLQCMTIASLDVYGCIKCGWYSNDD